MSAYLAKYAKQLTNKVMLAFIAVTLAGCGGGSDTIDTATIETPLICKAPNTLSADGSTCEFIPPQCRYPEVPTDDGLCTMDLGQWVDGANGITMPTPEYVVQEGEIVLYYNLQTDDYLDWGLHAWNNDECNSYADFEPTGGTDWTVPIPPTGIDPNFGAYWVMDIIAEPNCAWFIPHSLELNAQTADLKAELYSAAQNPTGAFFVLEGSEQYIFPYPRTFESLVVPGGASLQCEAPLVLNEAGDECIPDPNQPDVFTPGETDLLLRGSMNEWGDTDQFHYAESVYTYTTNLPASADAYEFKIADANWSESTSFGAVAGEEAVVLGEAKTLTVTEGQNLTILAENGGNFQFTFDATDPEAPVLTVIEVTYDKNMFLKGSMNEWSNTHMMTYAGDNIYTIDFALEVADYEFKIADADWTEATNFGAAEGDEDLALEMDKVLVFGEGIAMNIKLSIAEAGNYRFTLDASMPQAPVLNVASAVPYGSAVLYLKGSMNGWSTVEGYEFSYADNHYMLTAMIPAGEHEFKIADDAWSPTATLGAVTGDDVLALDEAKTLTLPGDNLKLTLEVDTLVSFDVNASDKAAPVLTMTEYIPFAGREMYLKGTMNDWSNNDDYKFTANTGIYTLDVSLDVASYEFKIADADWQPDSTVGAVEGEDMVTLGEAFTATLPGENIKLDITEQKDYRITLDATNPMTPVLMVEGL